MNGTVHFHNINISIGWSNRTWQIWWIAFMSYIVRFRIHYLSVSAMFSTIRNFPHHRITLPSVSFAIPLPFLASLAPHHFLRTLLCVVSLYLRLYVAIDVGIATPHTSIHSSINDATSLATTDDNDDDATIHTEVVRFIWKLFRFTPFFIIPRTSEEEA